jgi:hypothetical protein
VPGQLADPVGEGLAAQVLELVAKVGADLVAQLVALGAQLPDLGAGQFEVRTQAGFAGCLAGALRRGPRWGRGCTPGRRMCNGCAKDSRLRPRGAGQEEEKG